MEIDEDTDSMFETKAGLLLDKTWHEDFDKLRWSLYYKVWNVLM